MLFSSENPTPDKTCAHQCCTSPFVSFSFPQMSSSDTACGYWKTARSDEQTTIRAFYKHLLSERRKAE